MYISLKLLPVRRIHLKTQATTSGRQTRLFAFVHSNESGCRACFEWAFVSFLYFVFVRYYVILAPEVRKAFSGIISEVPHVLHDIYVLLVPAAATRGFCRVCTYYKSKGLCYSRLPACTVCTFVVVSSLLPDEKSRTFCLSK